MSELHTEPPSEPIKGDCNATDGYSVCAEPPGHGPTHWDSRTKHEWTDDGLTCTCGGEAFDAKPDQQYGPVTVCRSCKREYVDEV